jgi:glycerol-3-phosphate dehydrogenase (NAD(P)+)
MTDRFQHFGVLGAGAWGTALAVNLSRTGHRVTLWLRDEALAQSINQRRENQTYLPEIPLDTAIRATVELEELKNCDALMLVTPAQHCRALLKALPVFSKQLPIILCAKGIERGTLQLLSEISAELRPQQPVAVLSGPNFATEIARGLPAAATLACADPQLGQALANAIGSKTFRPYVSPDLVGVQIGGAVKNVLAIACGMVEGRRLGDNARAAIITRGLYEMTRLGVACGGRAETFMGLSGLGDLVLTCTGTQSRNMSLGYALGQGEALADVLAKRKTVAEGVSTAAASVALAQKYNVELPICAAVNRILDEAADLDDQIANLLARPLKSES